MRSSTTRSYLILKQFHILFGGFSFHDHNISKDWAEFGASSFTLPEWSIIVEGSLCLLTTTFHIHFSDTEKSLTDSIYQRLEYLNKLCSSEAYEVGTEFDGKHSVMLPEYRFSGFSKLEILNYKSYRPDR
jgi:hypothetical protein